VAAALVAIAALLAGTAVALWEARVAADERDRALVQLQRAEATNDLSSFLLSEATPTAGRPITNAELLARGERLVDRRFAADPGLRVHMLLTLADRYHENQQFDDWQRTLEHAFALSRGIADQRLRSRAACALSVSMAEQGNVTATEALLSSALAGLAGLPATEWDEARCRVAESNAARLQGDLPRAIEAGERALALEDRRRGPAGREFDALAALSLAYGKDRFASADRVYRRMDALLASQGRDHTRDAAAFLNNWSAMLQNSGHHLAALPLAERAVRVAREQDAENGASLTQLRTYATALTVVGRAREAIPVMDEALTKARAAGSARRLFDVLGAAATTYREAGELETADRMLREADELLSADAAATPAMRGVYERTLARLAIARGDAQRAVDVARRAVSRYDPVARPHETLIALLVLAEAHNAGGEHDAALAVAQRALKMANERLGGMAHSYNVGQAHLELGVAYAGRGQLHAARAELQQAVDHLQPSVGPLAPTTRRAAESLSRLSS
jgi:serine/threonine-protein kinase